MMSRLYIARPVAALLSAAAVLMLTLPRTALAQDYPSRPIRFLVGFAPGRIADLLARALGQKLVDAWGQQVIIDNRAGGGGLIAMQLAAKAAPEGYTLLMGSSTQFSINPALRPKLPYDPVRDYTAVAQAAITPVILTTQTSSPVRTLQELIQLAKKPGEALSYGSSGYGGAPHIAGELLKRTTGITMTHVPYKGGSDSIIALMGGHVHVAVGAVSTAQPHLRGGRLRVLGVTTLKRLSAIPDVPTFVEQGLPGFEVVQWYGVFAPAGLPQPRLNKANDTLSRALGAAEFREQFNAQGVELMPATPAVFAAYVRNELVRWTRVLKEMGINEAP